MRASGGPPWVTRLALALAVTALTGAVAAFMVHRGLSQERAELVFIADNHAQMLEAWFAERLASAGLSATSFPQAEKYTAWREEGDPSASVRLFLRLRQFAEAGGFAAVSLLDEEGQLLWSSSERAHGSSPLPKSSAWASGASPGTFGLAGYHRDAEGLMHVDFVAALPTGPLRAAPLVVYHTVADDLLPERLARWASPHASARVVAFRAADAGVDGLAWPLDGEAAQTPGERRVRSWFVEDGETASLALQLASAELPPLVPAEGRDHRGVRVVGAGTEVADTGWYVLAQVDRSDFRGVFSRATWLAIGVALLAYLAGLQVVQRFRAAQRATLAAETERRRSERLLGAIADASPDAVFAKDLEGRYMFINRAGSRLVGYSSSEVIGKTDLQLFPEAQAVRLREAERELAESNMERTVEEHVTTTMGERVYSANKGPLRDAEGRAYGTYGVSRDVTEWIAAQRSLEEQARTLSESVAELERFNRVLVDRELVMVDLKRQLNAFARRLGEPEPYPGADEFPRDPGDA